jgi:hypothetical protein
VFFEEEGEIEQGLCKEAAMVEQQGNEQASKATIAVEKRMDGLELHMSQRGFEQEGQTCIILMKEGFQCSHAGFDFLRRWRDETGIPRPGAPDPILAAAKLAGLFVTATAFGHESGVHFAQ